MTEKLIFRFSERKFREKNWKKFNVATFSSQKGNEKVLDIEWSDKLHPTTAPHIYI